MSCPKCNAFQKVAGLNYCGACGADMQASVSAPVQGVVVVAPAPQLMQVQVPMGIGPGQMMQVMSPSGQAFNVQVPQGVTSGAVISVQPPGAQQPMQMQAPPSQLMGGRAPPPGLPAGGQWQTVNYCGIGSFLICCCCGLPCIAFCPVDSADLYTPPVVGGIPCNVRGSPEDPFLAGGLCASVKRTG